jgi:hypothetical protein
MNRPPASFPLRPFPPAREGGGAGPASAPALRAGSRVATGRAMQSAAAVALSALMLVWPAFWNGYPLIFADTGTYLGQALLIYLGWDRPPFYSVFLFATHWRLTLWGPILAQGLIVAHLLGVCLRVLGQPNPWLLLPVAFLLGVLTGLPWFAAQLMPDMFTGVVVLALWLLGFRAELLSRGERLWMLLLATAAIAFHQSHLPLALGLALCGGALLLVWRGARPALIGTTRMAAPIVAVVVALLAVNFAAHGRASPSPFGSVFLATRLIYDGPGMDMLRRACPEAGWRVCPALDRLGAGHNAFLWEPTSPLHTELGGPKRWGAEASAIVSETLRQAPGAVVLGILGNTWRQFFLLDTGDGLEPWPGVPGPEPLIARFFPHELRRFLDSRQQKGLLQHDAEAITPLHRAAALLGLGSLVVVLVVRRRRRGLAKLALALFILAAAAGNAAVTGGLSGPAIRYQARLAWLFVLAPAALLLPSVASVRRPVERRETA